MKISSVGLNRRAMIASSIFGLASCVSKDQPKQQEPRRIDSPTKIGYIYFRTVINQRTKGFFIDDCKKLIAQGCNQINIGMMTHGGEVGPTIDMVNYMASLQNNGEVLFTTHNIGYVESAGCYIFLEGRQRFCVPNGTFLFHAVVRLVQNETLNAEDLREYLNELEAIDSALLRFLRQTTSMSDGEADTLIRRQVVLYAKDAIRDGIISGVSDFSMPSGSLWFDIKDANDASVPPVDGDFSDQHSIVP